MTYGWLLFIVDRGAASMKNMYKGLVNIESRIDNVLAYILNLACYIPKERESLRRLLCT